MESNEACLDFSALLEQEENIVGRISISKRPNLKTRADMLRLIEYVLMTSLFFVTIVASAPWNFTGTTPNIREIFLGRCWQYQVLTSLNKLDFLTYDVNCTDLWNAFFKAVAFKEICSVTEDDYRPMFDLLSRPKKLKDKALFWSGSSDLVRGFTCLTDDYITLEDTLPGYLFDGLRWCGSLSPSSDGFNYTDCITLPGCSLTRPLWVLASQQFTQYAEGTAYVMINGSRNGNAPTYFEHSFFRSVEVPVMRVAKLMVLVVSDLDRKPIERCMTGSLAILKRDVEARGALVECVEDPKFVIRILCSKFPDAMECQDAVASGIQRSTEWQISSIVLASVCLLLLLICGYLAQKHYHPCRKPQLGRFNSTIRSTHPMIIGEVLEHPIETVKKPEGWV